MAHGEYIMDKVNEELVDSVVIPEDLSTAKAKALLTRCMKQRVPHAAPTEGEMTPVNILEVHFFASGLWRGKDYSYQVEQPMDASKNAGMVKTKTVYGGLALPKVEGATNADYTALLFRVCGFNYRPYVGVKTRNDALRVMEEEGYSIG